MTSDPWQVTHDTWHVTHRWWWTLSQHFRSLALTVWECWWFEHLESRSHLINQWINDKGVCRRTPPTPCLLNTGTICTFSVFWSILIYALCKTVWFRNFWIQDNKYFMQPWCHCCPFQCASVIVSICLTPSPTCVSSRTQRDHIRKMFNKYQISVINTKYCIPHTE